MTGWGLSVQDTSGHDWLGTLGKGNGIWGQLMCQHRGACLRTGGLCDPRRAGGHGDAGQGRRGPGAAWRPIGHRGALHRLGALPVLKALQSDVSVLSLSPRAIVTVIATVTAPMSSGLAHLCVCVSL